MKNLVGFKLFFSTQQSSAKVENFRSRNKSKVMLIKFIRKPWIDVGIRKSSKVGQDSNKNHERFTKVFLPDMTSKAHPCTKRFDSVFCCLWGCCEDDVVKTSPRFWSNERSAEKLKMQVVARRSLWTYCRDVASSWRTVTERSVNITKFTQKCF